MAAPANNRPPLWSRLGDIVAPRPGRAAFAARIALICALTVLVAEINGIPEIALAAYVVFFINNADRTSSVLAAMVFLLLTNVLIGALVLIAAQVLDSPPLRLLAMVGCSVALLFLASASRLKPLAPIIAMILVYALDAIGHIPSGELATRALLYAWLLIALPSVVTVVVNLLLGPGPDWLARNTIAWKLGAAARVLRSQRARPGLQAARATGAGPALALLRLAGVEKRVPATDLAALRAAARTTEALLMVSQAIEACVDVPAFWKLRAAGTLDAMASILAAGSHPLQIAAIAPDAAAIPDAAAGLIQDFNALLEQFTQTPALDADAPPPPPRFLLADAWTNPVHIRHAVKVTAAAMFCYVFYSATDWQGIHTSLITCYMVALGSTAETTEKLLLRITGALAGATVGLALIVWALPLLDGIGGLLMLVAGAAFVGGWIVASGPRVGYIGFQFSFAVFLCVIQGTAPAFDLTVARDRIIGILIGNAVIYLLFAHVWPVSIAAAIDTATDALLRQLARVSAMPSGTQRLRALASTHADARAIKDNLQVARFEPAALRRGDDWFAQRRHLLQNATRVESALLHADGIAQAEAARLLKLADVLRHASQGAVATTQGERNHAD